MELTPYYMAKTGYEFYLAARNHTSVGKRHFVKLYLFAVSIELGLKAFFLNDNLSESSKKTSKKLGHNLVKLWNACNTRGLTLALTDNESDALEKLNQFFASKSLEYGSVELFIELMTGAKGYPNIRYVGQVAKKVSESSKSARYFVASDTPKHMR